MIISDFNRFGGKHTETGALKNVLAYAGVVAPHTRQPYTEAMLFGIGGGIGFAYFLFEKNGSHPIHLGTRVHTKETERPEFFLNIVGRLGMRLRVQNSSSATAAESNLRRHLDQGQTPIVSVDPERLPYLGLSTSMHTYYCVVVYGLDEATNQVMISDRCSQPLTLAREQMRAARETSWSPKYRAMLVEPNDAQTDIEGAVRQGLANCYQQMTQGLGITNFGLRGMEKWATVLISLKEKKSWPKIFSPGATLYEALYSMFAQISGRCNTGNANRALYAEFLEEAGDILSNPGLKAVADNYRMCDAAWAEVADAHLPGSVPIFEEAKELTLRRRDLFESQGPDAGEEILRIQRRLEQIFEEASATFPLSFQDSRALLNDLRMRVLKLRDVEGEAVRALEAAAGLAPAEVAPLVSAAHELESVRG